MDDNRVLLMQDPFGSLPATQQQRRSSSDVDFADVFGGPPRRSSVADLRRSRERSMDSWSRHGSGIGEKPVFGGETSSPARRRHLKDDFYSDIFGSGGESPSSSPRREFFPPSSPGSRISSPTRSSLPAQISLSMKSVKDQPVFGSPTHRPIYKSDEGSLPSSSTPRAVAAQDDLKLDGHGLYRQSPLSRPNSQSMESSPEVTDSPSVSVEIHSQKDQASLESYISSGQFHFSTYRWAGKGVKLVTSSSSKSKYGSMFEKLPDIVVEEVDMNLESEDISTPTTASKILSGSQDNKLLKNLFVEDKQGAKSTLIDDLLPTESDSKFLPGDRTKILGNEDIIRLVGGEEQVVSGGQNSVYNTSIKQQAGKENKRKPVEVSSPTTSDSSISQEEKKGGSKMKGKVKDFIKKFNQETFSKRKGTFEASEKRSRGKDEDKVEVEDQVNTSTAKVEEHVETVRNNNSASSDIPVPMNLKLEKEGKANTDINSDVHITDDFSDRNDSSRHFSDSTPEILDASTWNVEESHCEDLEGCLIQEISEDQNRNLQTDSLQDQTKSIDAKIREWSKGKEGNIRSLLSTLHYILWPESGWKQVPLVDIIEGAPVKRAYQKALLCLHPDKLQQKGASAHQKYTAEKVFDILQFDVGNLRKPFLHFRWSDIYCTTLISTRNN
ncbi:J domain-containing protein required for chloroplast accumulation response 1-like isoform X1 [Iris pallida]|uniref:J domain-containing protein required for chloroplast accumulation response 1-like isoform X1 n=1 Tax=Iris pallida TaxID=29817 RepID=A0AAX6EWZ4_IRIPA|nr:J domain-containing protein required for chloroplast accumulation response 1-like isoform X1 [Iris pallida]